MTEDFLHYLWKFSLFSKVNLKTTSKETLQIINAGTHNLNTGPDFINAKIRIGNQLWAGNVEIHLKASNWYTHNHQNDTNYDAVILHVIFEDDVEVFDVNNSLIATLVIKNYIPKALLNNYQKLFSKPQKWIYCEKDFSKIDSFVMANWLERLFFERLENKANFIKKLLEETKNDWEAVLFYLLAKNFGLKINAQAFLSFSRSFDFNIVRKERFDLETLEALFFGQAGLLETEFDNLYFKRLNKKYLYLKHKYALEKPSAKVQFFRLRPANFPTIRISQLANLYHKQDLLFSEIINVKNSKICYDLLSVSTTTFWETHYTFGNDSKKRVKKISKSMVDLMIINTIIPLQFVYQKSIGKLDIQKLINLQQQVLSEKNSTIERFVSIGFKSTSALESQALLQLKNRYCDGGKCLQCEIGSFLIKN